MLTADYGTGYIAPTMTEPPQRVDIRDREELLYLLSEAGAFEHTVMCSYLYALWTLKRPGEGPTHARSGFSSGD